ncbi:MAG: MBL fold metallo-hydrolase [Candidatus Protochlamydia sp.]|nr:MBL fold metallo-hydrolase [Candidatus Protochlamydia sp.]
MYWKLTSKPKLWPNGHKTSIDSPPARVEGSQLRISFVGHSTMLIQTQSLNIITDPIWSFRASPFKFFGPKRYSKPGIPFNKLPPIDLVLISHNHYDHLDVATLKKIWKRDHPRVIAPLGNDAVVHCKAPEIDVETLDWHGSIPITPKLIIHLTPTQHWSARNLLDRNKALWGAFVILTEAGNIFFCGDSGYGSGELFRKMHANFGPFRFAMLPIGAYEPRWFMNYAHMNPVEAVMACKDLGEPYSAAIHIETFRLGDEGMNDPRQILAAACQKFNLDTNRFRALRIGEAWVVPEKQGH